MPAPGYPGGPKMEPKRGLDADYYEAVSEEIWQRREAADGEVSAAARKTSRGSEADLKEQGSGSKR